MSSARLSVSRRFVSHHFNLGRRDVSIHPEPQRASRASIRKLPPTKLDSFLEERRHSQEIASLVATAETMFPMHCISIQDLLEFDHLPSYDEVDAMGKFVIPEEDDSREILFVSHQWCGYSHPDPTGRQFAVLQEALKSLLEGRTVYPDAAMMGTPGLPGKRNFAKMFKKILVWMDFMSVPQLKARYANDQDKEEEGQDDDGNDHDPKRLQTMMHAINSVPAYIQRSSVMLILAPVVPHYEESTDCQFSSWRNRGWCRLEAVTSSLVGAEKCMILVESKSQITLFMANDMLSRHIQSVGCGEFACCTRNHVIEVDGVMTTITCDRTKISALISNLFDKQLQARAKAKDLSAFRFLLAHEHVILKNLPCQADRPTYNTWPEFARVFHLNVTEPLKKTTGMYKWAPIIYATWANNFPVVSHLLKCKADVNESTGKSGNSTCNYTPLHIIMKVGHGESGHQIFDSLLYAKANPYQCCWGGRFSKPTHMDPFGAGLYGVNMDMCQHFMNMTKPHFHGLVDEYGTTNETTLISLGMYELLLASLNYGATFQSRDDIGGTALGAFCVEAKENQISSDVRILDILHERGLLPDLNGKTMNESGFTYLIFVAMWHCRNLGFFKKNPLMDFVHKVVGGTYLHQAVYRDKPELVDWLLHHSADPNSIHQQTKNIQKSKNKSGQTPLELAQHLKYERCIGLLAGDKKILRRYSTMRSSQHSSSSSQ